MDNTNFIINDLEEFVESARRVVFNGFGKAAAETPDDFTELIYDLSPEEETELDSVLSQSESKLIVQPLLKKQTNKQKNKVRYLINEQIFGEIIESLNARLVSNILSELSKKGMIESAYDDDINDFVFWVKEDENKKDNQKPETD